ncbi:MAG: peptidoglycan-binding protein, partial [Gammaproteobacteria bacterium]
MRLIELPEITDSVPIDQLTPEQLKELQKSLAVLGYPVGDIDGLYGPKTRNAWAEYKTDVYHGNPNFIGPESIEKLQEQLTNAGESRYHDFSTKQGTIDAIKAECASQGIGLKTQVSYVLATTQWETAQTFRPVKEAYWLSEDWRKNNLRYFPYYGRGYVQLTWEKNYEKYSR